jgi:chemotaxis protein methyltransferase WspC
VVPETYFFRDRKPFEFLIKTVQSDARFRAVTTKLNLLSVPCSTGEEPYSLAMALFAAGIPATRFSIDAIDISKVALNKAKRAIYGKNSFRGEPFVDHDRYFQQTAEGSEVFASVRNTVRFRQGNLLTAFANAQAKYDIIFCRNLLIYLEPSVCSEILKTLHHLLLPQGLLFVGASETSKVPLDRFASMRQPFTFAYQKVDPSMPKAMPKVDPFAMLDDLPTLQTKGSFVQKASSELDQEAPRRRSNDDQRVREFFTQRYGLTPKFNDRPRPDPMPDPAPTAPALTLETAQQLANAGKFDAAIDHCKSYLTQNSTSADAYALLGTLFQAKAENAEAERYFRKALYLEPNHYEALVHLALLREHRGDLAEAELLQQRIQKLSNTSKPSR